VGEVHKLVVAVFVFLHKKGTILLVRQDYGHQYWSLPGGVVEAGEAIDQAAVREVKEETGLDIHLRRVIGLYSKPGENALAITFEGAALGGELRAGNEILDCRYFATDRFPVPVREHLQERVEDFQSNLPHAVCRTQ